MKEKGEIDLIHTYRLQGLGFFRIPRNTMEVPPKSEAAARTSHHIPGPWVNTRHSKGPAPLGRKQREDRDCNAVAMVHSVKVLRILFYFFTFFSPSLLSTCLCYCKGKPRIAVLVRHLFWLSTWRRSEMGWGWWLSQNITQQIINPQRNSMSGCFPWQASQVCRETPSQILQEIILLLRAGRAIAHSGEWGGVCMGSQTGAWRGCREWMGVSDQSSSGANEPHGSTGQGSSLGCCSTAK